MKKYNNQKGFAHPFTFIVIAGVLTLVGFAGWRVAKTAKTASNSKKDTSSSLTEKASDPVTAEAKLKEKTPETTTDVTVPAPVTTNKTTIKPTTTAPNVTPATNCGSPLYNGTNTAFMETETYIATKKFKAALEFAGLTNTVNANKTVVFTVSDSRFDSLNEAQKTFMNLSADNMRSVLGWHIITSCQTYAAVFKDAKSPIILQTLNGPVTYSLSGHGKVEAAEIGIWDWFTTNGAVHYIGDFIKPPQL